MAVLITSGLLPVKGKLISDYSEGDIVKLNENGSPIEFYVAKHDYESGLNGEGRTLLVRKDGHSKGKWDSEPINAYVSSTIDVWLEETYKPLLDSDVLNAIDATTFYYTPGDMTYTVKTLSRSVFLLSVTELGLTATYGNTEGSTLPIASTLQTVYLDGTSSTQWTRTPYKNGDNQTYAVKGSYVGQYLAYENLCIRPCFTLPSTAVFNSKTNEFIKA